jgi:hypothetical protein
MGQINITEQIRDRYEERLRKLLKVRDGLQYNRNTELGEIGSWIITKQSGIKDALKLIVDKACPIYIHHKYGSGVFKWDYINNEFQCELWSEKKMLDDYRSSNLNFMKEKMIAYWRYCAYKKS